MPDKLLSGFFVLFFSSQKRRRRLSCQECARVLSGAGSEKNMAYITIKSMEENLQKEVKMRVLVESISFTQKEGGNRWADLFVSDATGKCTFKIWGEQFSTELEEKLPAFENNVIECVGLVEMWQGTLSLRISAPSLKIAEEGSYDPAEFFPSLAKGGKEQLLNRYKELLKHLKDIGSAYYGLVLYSFTVPRIDAMAIMPGGVKTHAFRGGLFLHLVETAEMAWEAAKRYNDNLALLPYGDVVDEGLVIAAALLHDLGKVSTLESVGTSTRSSLRGLWVGNTVQSILSVNCTNCKVAEEYRVSDALFAELVHCIEACDSFAEETPCRSQEAMICRNANLLSEQLHVFNKAWYENERKGRDGNITYNKDVGCTIIRRRKEEIG